MSVIDHAPFASETNIHTQEISIGNRCITISKTQNFCLKHKHPGKTGYLQDPNWNNWTPLGSVATLSFKVILLSPVSVSEKAGALSQKGHT